MPLETPSTLNWNLRVLVLWHFQLESSWRVWAWPLFWDKGNSFGYVGGPGFRRLRGGGGAVAFLQAGIPCQPEAPTQPKL